MNFPSSSSSSSQHSSLAIFDDQTAEAAAALLQIRGSPRTPHLPFIPDFSHSFVSPSPVSTTPSYNPRQHSTLPDSRYYVPVETNGLVSASGSGSGSGPVQLSLPYSTEYVPSSIPIINVPSPLRKRKRSLASDSTVVEAQQPSTNKGKTVDETPPSEEPSNNKSVLENDGVVRCICELQVDDGFMIQCESCQVWQHAACMRIHPKTVPQVYLCEQCNPRLVDGVRARRALLSRLQAKNAQKQAQEKKKQPRRTSSEATSKQRKGTSSASPQPSQTHQPVSRRQSSTSLTSPSQPYSLLHFDSQSLNPYPITKDEVMSPIAPFAPIIDSTSSTPSTFYNPLPSRQPKDVSHILYPQMDTSRFDRCQFCDGSDLKCDHPLPPVITLHSAKPYPGEHNPSFQHTPYPNVLLRPFICDNKSNRREFVPQDNAAQNESTYMGIGIFALHDIKMGEEIVLGCEWETTSKEPRYPNSFASPPDRVHVCSVSTVLTNFSTCACGLPTESCASVWCRRRLLNQTHQSNDVHEDTLIQKKAAQQLPPSNENPQANCSVSSARAKKKPKTAAVKEGARKTNAPTARKRKSVTNGKGGIASKLKAKDMDIDQDVDIDAKSDEVNVGHSLESPTNALATLSLRGTPENQDKEQQQQHPSHELESTVDPVSKSSDKQDSSTSASEDNIPSAVATAQGPRSRASEVTTASLLEPPTTFSPRSSAIKPISAVVFSPLLPSSAVNAHPAAHILSSVTVESVDIPVVSLPPAVKEPPPTTTGETAKKLPIKRLSLADWKISKDKEKRALKEAQAQEKVIMEQDTERTCANDDTAERNGAEVKHLDSSDVALKTSSRPSSVDIGDRTTGDTSFSTKSDMTTIPISTGLMESGVMELKVEVGDDCSTTEARPFTSPQVPSCSLHADSSSDPRHTPPCTPSVIVDDQHSPFETAFEEGEIKPSSPPSKDQAPLPPICSPSQTQQTSRRSRSASPSHSPPTRPRSYHHQQLHQRPPPPRSLSPLSSSGAYGRSLSNGPPRSFSTRPIPSAPRALRGGAPPRHPSSFSSSYRPNNYRDYDRHRGSAHSHSSNSRFYDSSSQSDSRRPWVDNPSWKR